ncbi:Molecular chaperone IbpA, HSP20 family [Halovenus aranensis]|jgi:HSP20 family molecular chaperone IbpA|uniref:Molecular chaperone IbpA, HSP20 family n=1 Tax=Halovenus aranensis TaxID=890420 RepID=A0A1G8WI90_9EURY|nr:Hsp20/alpha crystallin family protein [Halovenus aranensis]SDJ77827.1 Molecular chaperone IbpA, HSP20 family [Halovenus aranensis]
MIQDLGESVGSSLFETVGRMFGRAQEQRPLPADLYESDDAFLAVFDAPGAHPADVQVKYEDDAIVVRVDRFRDFYDGFEMQFPGRGLTLDGRVAVPTDAEVDPDEASATLTDAGTLRVQLPKTSPESATADES